MKITPQMNEISATKQAIKAIGHTLRRIEESPTVAYYCGYGTQIYSLLTEAQATLTGRTIEEIQEDFPPAPQKEYTGEQLAPCPFCGCHSLEIVTACDHQVSCNDCEILGPLGETKEEARERWNDRAMPRG